MTEDKINFKQHFLLSKNQPHLIAMYSQKLNNLQNRGAIGGFSVEGFEEGLGRKYNKKVISLWFMIQT